MPAQSYFEHLEERIQDGLLWAEALSHVVCLKAEEQHLNNNGAESWHVAMCFHGSTRRSKKKDNQLRTLKVSARSKQSFSMSGVCLKTPRPPVLQRRTDATWEEHSRCLKDAKTFNLEFDVSFGQKRYPSLHMCLAYLDRVRVEGFTLEDALTAARSYETAQHVATFPLLIPSHTPNCHSVCSPMFFSYGTRNITCSPNSHNATSDRIPSTRG